MLIQRIIIKTVDNTTTPQLLGRVKTFVIKHSLWMIVYLPVENYDSYPVATYSQCVIDRAVLDLRVRCLSLGSLHVFHLVECFPGLLQLFVHGKELAHTSIHTRVLTNQENDVLNLNNFTHKPVNGSVTIISYSTDTVKQKSSRLLNACRVIRCITYSTI